MERLDIRRLEFPKDLALLSRQVKELPPKGVVEVFHSPQQLERIKNWCSETGNILKEHSPERSILEKGKGFHGVCLGEKVSFYLTGAKLHLREYLLKFRGKYPPYLFNFISIPEAQKGLKILENLTEDFTVLPSPKEVESYCGFAVGFNDYQACERFFKELLLRGVGVEVIFQKVEKGFKTLKGAWEF